MQLVYHECACSSWSKHVGSIDIYSCRSTNSFDTYWQQCQTPAMYVVHTSIIEAVDLWNLRFPQVTWDDPLPPLRNFEAFSLQKVFCNLFHKGIIPRIPIDAWEPEAVELVLDIIALRRHGLLEHVRVQLGSTLGKGFRICPELSVGLMRSIWGS